MKDNEMKKIWEFIQEIIDSKYEYHLELYSNCLDKRITIYWKENLKRLLDYISF